MQKLMEDKARCLNLKKKKKKRGLKGEKIADRRERAIQVELEEISLSRKTKYWSRLLKTKHKKRKNLYTLRHILLAFWNQKTVLKAST